MNEQLKACYDQLKQLLETTHIIINDDNDDLSKSLKYLFSRIVETSQSILILLENKKFIDSEALLRISFEAMIKLKYLYNHTNKAEFFIKAQYIEHYRHSIAMKHYAENKIAKNEDVKFWSSELDKNNEKINELKVIVKDILEQLYKEEETNKENSIERFINQENVEYTINIFGKSYKKILEEMINDDDIKKIYADPSYYLTQSLPSGAIHSDYYSLCYFYGNPTENVYCNISMLHTAQTFLLAFKIMCECKFIQKDNKIEVLDALIINLRKELQKQ